MSHGAAFKPPDAPVPSIVNRKVPMRRPNAAYRSREYLLEKEVADLITAAARQGRHGSRDAALILIAYRHGFVRMGVSSGTVDATIHF